MMPQAFSSMRPFAGWLVLGGVTFVGCCLWLMPLSMVTSLSGLSRKGLTARTVDGTAWNGRIFDATFRETQMGDIQVKLSPLALLGGKARFRLEGSTITGEGFIGPNAWGLRNIDATMTPGAPMHGLGLDNVRLTGLTIQSDNGRCTEASGQMTAYVPSGALSRVSGPQLSGPAACSNGNLSFRLSDTSGKAILNLEYPAKASARFTILLRADAVTDKAALAALGFTETPVGFKKSGQLPD